MIAITAFVCGALSGAGGILLQSPDYADTRIGLLLLVIGLLLGGSIIAIDHYEKHGD